MVSFDCCIGANGSLAVSFINRADRRFFGIQLKSGGRVLCWRDDRYWSRSAFDTPSQWCRVELLFDPEQRVCLPRLILDDGTCKASAVALR